MLPDVKSIPSLLKTVLPVFMCSLLLYAALFLSRVLMDIPSQMYTLRQVCHGEVAMPPTLLFYVMGWVFALGQCSSKLMLGMGAAISCALLLSAKWWLTRTYALEYLRTRALQLPWYREQPEQMVGWMALALCLVCSLPTPDLWHKGWYIIGQASPNYWMNGTLLASWPFALVLYWQSARQLEAPEAGWWRYMLLWLVLLVISKPSYAFVFAMVYPLFLWRIQGVNRTTIRHFLPFVVLGLLLALEYYLIFLQADSVYVKQFNAGQSSGVQWSFLGVWRMFSSHIPISIAASVLFPAAVATMYWKQLHARLHFRYAWAGFGVALLISATLAQKGEEFSCWNFRWQTYIAAYILFFVSTLYALELAQKTKDRFDWRSKTAFCLFALHLLSGVGYLLKMFLTKSHY